MRTGLTFSAFAYALVFHTSACQEGSPVVSVTEATVATGTTSAVLSSTEGTSVTTGDGLTGTDSGTSPDTGETDPHVICQRYIACISVVAPAQLPEAQMGFGDNGTCWQGSQTDAQLCMDACEAGLTMFNELFPEEAKCALCQDHSECDTAAGELCHLGKCEVTTCGNGLVEAEEICDLQPNCDLDCQGPQPCNPMSAYGCGQLSICRVASILIDGVPTVNAECWDSFGTADVGGSCGHENYCAAGLGCAIKAIHPSCVAPDDEGCCAPYCDLGDSKPCTAGLQCVAYEDWSGFSMVPELGFLGVCVPT